MYFKLRQLGILCLSCLSFLEAGKNKIISENCVSLLCARLQDTCSLCREHVILALASLSQMKQGKIEILPFFRIIKKLLETETEEKILLNLIELIASLAEHPQGRIQAKECLERLEKLKEMEFLNEYIIDAIGVITWIP